MVIEIYGRCAKIGRVVLKNLLHSSTPLYLIDQIRGDTLGIGASSKWLVYWDTIEHLPHLWNGDRKWL